MNLEQLKLLPYAGRLALLGMETTGASMIRALRRGRAELESPCEPVVLMHGFAGFRELGIGGYAFLEYFNGVRRFLGQIGYRVFAPEVAPFNPPLERAREWLGHIEAIRAETGAEKVHLIGHSQGGLDARVLVAPACPAQDTPIGPLLGLGYGPHVASLTTLSTPHLGSALADELEQEEPAHQKAVDTLLALVGLVATIVRGDPQDARRAVLALSRSYVLEYFNRIIADDPAVPCHAIAGDPGSELVGPLLRPVFEALSDLDPSEGGGPNDGLVTVKSALFGNVPEGRAAGSKRARPDAQRRKHWKTLGLIQADHITEVGIPLQMPHRAAYDHFALFAGLAQLRDPSYTAALALQRDGRWRRTRRRRQATASGRRARSSAPGSRVRGASSSRS
jgi:triacylglycerol lipase